MGPFGGRCEKGKEKTKWVDTYASIKKAAQPPCKLPSGLSISKNEHKEESLRFQFSYFLLSQKGPGGAVHYGYSTDLL